MEKQQEEKLYKLLGEIETLLVQVSRCIYQAQNILMPDKPVFMRAKDYKRNSYAVELEKPRRLVIVLDESSKIVSLNRVELRPWQTNRAIWTTMRDMWLEEIGFALARLETVPVFTNANVLVVVPNPAADLDNYGLKAIVDSLVKAHVLDGDEPGHVNAIAIVSSKAFVPVSNGIVIIVSEGQSWERCFDLENLATEVLKRRNETLGQ